jgi:hypothetical protein
MLADEIHRSAGREGHGSKQVTAIGSETTWRGTTVTKQIGRCAGRAIITDPAKGRQGCNDAVAIERIIRDRVAGQVAGL